MHGNDGFFFLFFAFFFLQKAAARELRGSLREAAEAGFCICEPHDVAKSKKRQPTILKSPFSGHSFKYSQRETQREAEGVTVAHSYIASVTTNNKKVI